MNRTAIALACCAVLPVAGCSAVDAPASDTVVRVGERQLSYDDFERYLELNSLEGEVGLPSAVLSGLFDQFILEELLLELAAADGIAVDDRRGALEELIDRRVVADVDPAAVEARYRARLDEYELPERVDIRQLLVSDRATAEAALARLEAGEPFEQVVITAQGDEARGGWVQRGLARDDLPPDIASVLFALQAGEVSEIVEADYGFLLFEVLARYEAQTLTLEEAAREIRVELEREAADRALRDLAAEAGQRYNVTVFDQNLPFDYLGNYRSETPS